MLVIKNNLIPFGRYTSMNLFGIIFTKVEIDEKTINHERIHAYQMLELDSVVAIIIFALIYFAGISSWWLLTACFAYYVWYIIEYMWISVMHNTQFCSYMDVSFEEEAYANDKDFSYIISRKPFAWIKYIACESNHPDGKDCCK